MQASYFTITIVSDFIFNYALKIQLNTNINKNFVVSKNFIQVFYFKQTTNFKKKNFILKFKINILFLPLQKEFL